MLQIIIFALYILFIYYWYVVRKKKKQWISPFERFHPNSIIERKDGTIIERPHNRFEYVGQMVNEGRIIGIVVTVKPSEKELKYEKLCAKWR